MKRIGNTILLGVAIGLAVSIPMAVYMTLDTIVHGIKVVLTFIGVTGVLALAYIGVMLWVRERHQHYRIIDGSLPLQRHRVAGHVVVVDPNKLPGAAYIVGPRIGYHEIESLIDPQVQLVINQAVQQTRSLAAITPGDHALIRTHGQAEQPKLPSSITKMLPGPSAVQAKVADAASQPTQTTVARIDAASAIVQSTGSRWVLGHADDGAALTFDPDAHFSLGIVGSTGTGKTSSVGFAAALAALRAGWHVVVINPDGDRRPPDGGPGWYMLQSHVELHDTDPDVFPHQVESIYDLYERRAAASNPRPVLVVFEEYGDVNRHLRRRSRADADTVDAMLDTILTRGRKHRIHTVFIDQYPEYWSNAVLGGTKMKAVFQLGPGQGAKVEEYKAGQLAPRGRFLVRGAEYASFDASAAVPALLRQLPAPNKRERVIGAVKRIQSPSVDVSPSPSETRSAMLPQVVDPPTLASPNAPNERSSDTRDAIFAYLDKNPAGTQADVRRALKTSNGYTNECWHAWHAERKEALTETSQPALVPDAIHGWREVVESESPASIQQMEEIRQAIAAGKISVG